MDGQNVKRSDNGSRIGVISETVAQVLQCLDEDENFEIQAFSQLVPGPSTTVRHQQKLLQSQEQHFLALNVNIYGTLDLYDGLGKFLTEVGLFLQTPEYCSKNVEYRNPQLLSRVGSTPMMTFDLSPKTIVDYCGLVHDGEVIDASNLMALLQDIPHLEETDGPSTLATKLHRHQKQALTFMLERERGWCFDGPRKDIWEKSLHNSGSVVYTNTITGKRQTYPPPAFSGGLLGDQMGLGKTLSIIALILSNKAKLSRKRPRFSHNVTKEVKTTLIVAPMSLLDTWGKQLNMHVKPDALLWKKFHGSKRPTLSTIKQCDIILTTFQTLSQESKLHQEHQFATETLFSLHWHRVVLDEAHIIQNRSTFLAKAVCALDAKHRWAISGTPIQNKLTDLASIFEFLRVHPFSDLATFKSEISDPWHRGEPDGILRLKNLVCMVALCRPQTVLNLPPRKNEVKLLEFSSAERDMYNAAKSKTVEVFKDQLTGQVESVTYLNCLKWLNRLRSICNHGVIQTSKSSGAFVNHDETGRGDWNASAAQQALQNMITSGLALCFGCSTNLEIGTYTSESALSKYASKHRLSQCLFLVCGKCISEQAKDTYSCGHSPSCPTFDISADSNKPAQRSKRVEIKMNPDERPTKLRALLKSLIKSQWGEKSVVFSYWTTTLDLIESMLKSEAITFTRIDGEMSGSQRTEAIEKFQKDGNIQVILVSITSGGTGLDLTAASRAYLMEPQWNPMIEEQAICRIYRMGQKRPVKIIRYRIRDSFEEKVVLLQDQKRDLAKLTFSNGKLSEEDISASRLNFLRVALG
ncbi:hypothetical protein L207DRAFT_142233 [Hyaloscypha variabilis F]|uniref:Uncharacterized protein n=1 Tax=Hyaloscypha variabilis (strain UAMH 11265 / GT02V1 / F) TaxID=1149755 RepID=A0A2J6R550_HYAVF|nr:hypothetical protein L207DRAFT_142233 [Hyaloscypha variabilis F]